MSKIISIANFFIEKSLKEELPIEPLKIQKLVYFAFGFYGQKHNKWLFENPIYNWSFGEVVPELHNLLKIEAWQQKGFLIKKPLKNAPYSLKNDEKDTLLKVWGRYKLMRFWDMAEDADKQGLTLENTPPGAELDKDRIIKYFQIAVPIIEDYSDLFIELSRE